MAHILTELVYHGVTVEIVPHKSKVVALELQQIPLEQLVPLEPKYSNISIAVIRYSNHRKYCGECMASENSRLNLNHIVHSELLVFDI